MRHGDRERESARGVGEINEERQTKRFFCGQLVWCFVLTDISGIKCCHFYHAPLNFN
jgi:hypothetical protein